MSTYSIHQFAEKVALVTDIVHPVGRAAAMQLALQGAFIIGGVPDDTSDSGDLADDLRELGTLASSVRYERSSVAGANALAEAGAATFGRLDLLINCVKSVDESAFLITDAVRDLMAGRPSARIVDVFEIDENDADGEKLIGHLREDLLRRAEALPAKFRLNGVAVIGGYEAEPEHALFRGRAATEPDDVARVVLFLLSSEAKAIRGELTVIRPPRR
ncbi:MAG: hypothetical protein KF855_04790 [Acidobacteria bacterium]|nr:hypothetical protein [Acidobacteriota bacterium]